MNLPADVMAERMARMASSKREWISDFSDGRKARPRHEIERQTENLEALEQASHAYAAKAKKEQACEAS